MTSFQQNFQANNNFNQNVNSQMQMTAPKKLVQNISPQRQSQTGFPPQNFSSKLPPQNNMKNNQYQIKKQKLETQNVFSHVNNNGFITNSDNRPQLKNNPTGVGLPDLSKKPQTSHSSNKNSSTTHPNNWNDENANIICTKEDRKYFDNFKENNKHINPLSLFPLLNKEHHNRHELEFMFIPNVLADLYSRSIIGDDILMNPILWKKKSRKISPIFLQKICVQKKVLNSGVTKFIIIFPTPKCGCECFFAILYFDEYKNSNYFTLEKEFGNDFGTTEGTGLVCGQKGLRHLNFFTICKVNLDDFENCIRKLYRED